ncbi:hypothetical protein X739_16105 [Mesorhizobium sp. LNHC220B00]|nr:hypothetical protein [Mesorhizobium sp. LNHC220B00]ESY85802.1 hypothetical protein X739_16105 [Mesorhizobium sp. LNHC220B00]
MSTRVEARDQGDVFVMSGLMVDAYKLRKKTADFDAKLEAIFAQHPGARGDLKTKRFINGAGAWNPVPAQQRKGFLREMLRARRRQRFAMEDARRPILGLQPLSPTF